MRFGAVAALALALSGMPLVAARAQEQPTPPPLSANAILARVKADARARARPPFVIYTLERRDEIDGLPNLADSYTLRIWCRTADRAALSRRVFGSRTVGPAEFVRPAFDAPVDPGPPTAELLDVIRQTSNVQRAPGAAPPPATSTPTPEPLPSGVRVIGAVTVFIERNYHVTLARDSGNDYHLVLVALHDPERYRLTDLYIYRTSFGIHRAVAHDRLFFAGGGEVPEHFEIDFGSYDDVPVIESIHGASDPAASRAQDFGSHAVVYAFTDIAFPATLPDWYFDASQYGAHRDEYPS